jgi:hypothetical protein
MNSRIVGKINLDEGLLKRDLEKIQGFGHVKEEYSEYRFGLWKNYVLWNGTGRQKDTLFRGMEGGAIRTEMGAEFDYINAVLVETFHTEKLKMVRANLLQDALLIPHRDYVEFKGDSDKLARLHIPLETDLNSLHSEDGTVFHMRRGEVWFLDVASVHSACNMSERPRISLVLDFGLDGQPLDSVFKNRAAYRTDLAPLLIEREPLDDDFRNAIAAMRHVISRANYKDLVLFLSRVHFYKDISSCLFFDWLIEMCREVPDRSLLEKSVRFKEYLIHSRELGERFYL